MNVDSSKTITHLSLCTGYGGIDIGLRRVLPTCRTIAYVEIEAFACANLVAKMEAGELDAAPIWTDLKTCDWEIFRDRVDILSGGYPCQPFSAAGQRKGKEDPRHLWPFIQRAIGIIRPGYCFFENVEGHLTLGFKDVCHDLGELGYDLTAGIFSAAECGASHQRKRVFILAHTNECGGNQDWFAGKLRASGVEQSSFHRWPSRPGEAQQEWEEPRVVGDADRSHGVDVRRSECGSEKQSEFGDPSAELGDTARSKWRPNDIGEQGQENEKANSTTASSAELADAEEHDRRHLQERSETLRSEQQSRRQIKSKLGRTTDGIAGGLDATANRVDRLRLLGNGVVPATCEVAFRTLYEELNP